MRDHHRLQPDFGCTGLAQRFLSPADSRIGFWRPTEARADVLAQDAQVLDTPTFAQDVAMDVRHHGAVLWSPSGFLGLQCAHGDPDSEDRQHSVSHRAHDIQLPLFTSKP